MHFDLKVEGERGLGFIYSFFITFVLCKKIVIFSNFRRGKRAWFCFHFLLKKLILKGVGV